MSIDWKQPKPPACPGLNQSVVGKRTMAATFVTDILTVIRLSLLFLTPSDRAAGSRYPSRAAFVGWFR